MVVIKYTTFTRGKVTESIRDHTDILLQTNFKVILF